MTSDADDDRSFLETYVRLQLDGLALLGLFLVIAVLLERVGFPLTRERVVLIVASAIVLVWICLGIVGLIGLFRRLRS